MTEDITEAPGPGAILRGAREKKGLSVRQAAEKLHLLPYQVAALEADDYLAFNGDIFCRGYLKSYASVLNLDVKSLIDAYIEIRPDRPERSYSAKDNAVHIQRPHKGRSIQYWCLAVLLVVIATLWFYGSMSSVDTEEPRADADIIVDGSGENAVTARGNMALDKQSAIASGEHGVEKEEGWSSAAASDEPNGAYADPAEFVLPDAFAEGVDDGINTQESSEGLLSFRFSGDCWVEVTDSNQAVLFADLKRANDVLQLSGLAPFTVLLGFAANVELEYNGEPVSFRANTTNNAASFSVGQL